MGTRSGRINAGADLGFYKGGCPIHLKGAPEVERRRSNIFPAFYVFKFSAPPPIILSHVTGTNQFLLALEETVGARRSYDV